MARGAGGRRGRSDIPDQRLALMFACAHPAIDPAIRAPLILQTVLGFDAATIASAFLVAPATMGQRLARAKNKIREAGMPFRVPERADLRERLDAVLAAIYAAFAEGWSDPAGTEARRRNLAEEGDLARPAGGLAAARRARGARPARADAVRRGAARRAAQRALATTCRSPSRTRRVGRAPDRGGRSAAAARGRAWARSAAISWRPRCSRPMWCAGCTGAADWAAIEKLYDALLALTGSPVVAINRAVAVAETRGRRRRPCGARRAVGRCAARRISALLGGARRAAGADRRHRGGRPRLRTRDRSRKRPGGAAFPARSPITPRGRGMTAVTIARVEHDRAVHSLRSLGSEADVRRDSARHARLPAGARHGEQRPGRLGRGVLGRLAGHAGRDRALGRAARGRAGHRRRRCSRASSARCTIFGRSGP